jgi:hypothetical protein
MLSSSEDSELCEEAGEEERGDRSRGSKRLYEKVPLPLGVIVPPPECTVGGKVGKSWKKAPWRRDFLPLKVKVVVVGVAGGEEGPACWWTKLKLGVVGRMIASLLYVCANGTSAQGQMC